MEGSRNISEMQKQIPFTDFILDRMCDHRTSDRWSDCIDKSVDILADLIYKCQNEYNPTQCMFDEGPYSFDSSQTIVIKKALRNEYKWRAQLRSFWHHETLDRSRIVERGIKKYPYHPPELVRVCITSYGVLDQQCCDCVNYGDCG